MGILDEAFAGTPRGVALIERIKGDPALGTCDIRIIGRSSEEGPAADDRTAAGVTGPSASLDAHGTRRALRAPSRRA